MKKGAKYQCTVCGMAVTVDKICGCVEAHDIVCCGTEMKPKKK
ncbi:MAG: desulforedoxin [Nitrospiraceae bacterium]|nr:MAG: desulforedoxin [Nitrospiraceae bacterium]